MKKKWQFAPVLICVVFCLGFCLGFRFVVTDGPSMEPTYTPGDLLLVGRALREPKAGDVVLIEHNGRLLVKRVLAVAGDAAIMPADPNCPIGPDTEAGTTTAYYDNALINANPVFSQAASVLREAASPLPNYWTTYHYWGDAVVPEGYVFVIGDNLQDSNDSRKMAFGLIPESSVWGYVLHIVWNK